MANARDCLLQHAADGTVDRQKAEDAAKRFDQIMGEMESEGGGRTWYQREATAAARLEAELRRDFDRKKRMRLRQAQAQTRVGERVAQAPAEPRQAMLSMLDFDPRGKVHGPNVSIQSEVIRKEAFGRMSSFLETFRPRRAGTYRRTAGLENTVRELFGEATGSAEAKAFATAIADAFDHLRGRFNVAGGDIAKRKSWGLPQGHDGTRIAAVEKGRWIDYTMERVDRSKMLGMDGEPISLRGLRQSLETMYDELSTGGLPAVAPIDPKNVNAVAARVHHRFLAFRDADSWLQYQSKFGTDDIMGTIIGHIDGLSRDIASMEVLGPYPMRTLELMERMAGGPNKHLRDTFRLVTGRLDQGGSAWWASVAQGVRNLTVAAKLGGAWFSSFADVATQALAARFVGMPATRVVAAHLKLFAPGSAADRRLAARLGFIAESWTSRAVAAQRIMGEVTGPGWTRALADVVMRASFLSHWSDAGKQAFSMELLGFVSDHAAVAFDQLPRPLRNTFGRHGIDASLWDVIRGTEAWADPETGEVRFIRPQDVAEAEHRDLPAGERYATGRKAGAALAQMIAVESRFAMTEPTARVRALLTGGLPAGTFFGELVRDVTLFKSFTITLSHLQMSRGMNMGALAAVRYFPQLFIGATVMGVLGDQLSEISKGKDPQPLDDPRTWGKGLARGGSLGLMGDFLFSLENRYGGTLLDSLAGPVVGEATNALSGVATNVHKLAQGKGSDFGNQVARFIHNNSPGQSLFYARLAFEREIFDNIDKLIDPDSADRFRRIEDRAKQDFRQSFWWRPGKALPGRP